MKGNCGREEHLRMTKWLARRSPLVICESSKTLSLSLLFAGEAASAQPPPSFRFPVGDWLEGGLAEGDARPAERASERRGEKHAALSWESKEEEEDIDVWPRDEFARPSARRFDSICRRRPRPPRRSSSPFRRKSKQTGAYVERRGRECLSL